MKARRNPLARFLRQVGLAALPFLALFAFALAAFGASKPSKRQGLHDDRATVERARALMGTICTGTIEATDTTWAARSLAMAFDEIDRLDPVLSSWRAESELSRINASGAERRVPCSDDLYAVLDSALAAAKETDGAFDPTIEAAERAWDLRGNGRVPSADELREARERVGWTMVLAEPNLHTVRFRREGMGLDFGGIGKGYALDRALELLRLRHIQRVLLNFGGEVAGFSDGDAWLVRIADPEDRLRPVVHLVLRRGAISTSGQGEHFVTVNGKPYGHILNPRTALPLATRATVTVVTRSGTLADAYSTALLVMGREKAAAFVAEHPDVGALWLEHEGNQLKAWRWNLPTLSVENGVDVEWQR